MKIRLAAAFSLAITSLSTISTAQSFEGTLVYAQDIEPPKSFLDMGITKETFLEKMKEKPEWFDTIRLTYKGGDYYMVTNGKQKTWKIYNAATNKIYSFSSTEDGDICAVQDAVDLDLSGEPDHPEISQPDTTVTINRYNCKLVRVIWKMSRIDYYYKEGIAKVNPALFEHHSSEAFNEFLKRSKALPVRIDRNVMGIRISHTLVSIKAKQVNASVFKLPILVEDPELNLLKMPGTEVFRVKP